MTVESSDKEMEPRMNADEHGLTQFNLIGVGDGMALVESAFLCVHLQFI